MKICKKLYGYLPNSIMRFIEKKVGNKDIKTLLQSIRLEKFLKNTDFENLAVERYPVCYIKNATWDYPMFHMYFITNMLDNIVYCLANKKRPIIQFENSQKINLWEQFLEQPYTLQKKETTKEYECEELDAALNWPINPKKEEIKDYAKLYKSFVKLNQKTKEYFDNEYNNIIKDKRVLGVLCRGTDYTANKPKGHPVQPPIKDVISLVEKKLLDLKCEWIYLATEEKKIAEQFERAFPKKILINKRKYFDEFHEIRNKQGEEARISWVHFDRENDNYYKSLEYFSSINLLSKCTALIAGNCGGSRTALYLNDNKYEYSYLFDLGIY